MKGRIMPRKCRRFLPGMVPDPLPQRNSDPGRERGIITLTMQARDDERESLERELGSIEGVKVRSLCLSEAIE